MTIDLLDGVECHKAIRAKGEYLIAAIRNAYAEKGILFFGSVANSEVVHAAMFGLRYNMTTADMVSRINNIIDNPSFHNEDDILEQHLRALTSYGMIQTVALETVAIACNECEGADFSKVNLHGLVSYAEDLLESHDGMQDIVETACREAFIGFSVACGDTPCTSDSRVLNIALAVSACVDTATSN